MAYDLKITDGVIIDGTGAPRFNGDIGISNGVIVAMGDAPDTARRSIKADGQVVSPGFIDIHTHYDAQVMWDPLLTVSPWHGVTTAVMGNCGFTLAPTRVEHRELILRTLERVEGMSLASLKEGIGAEWGFSSYAEYLDVIERRPLGINVASLIGHTAIRLFVMGRAATERVATPDEIAQMKNLVKEGLRAGAIGFSTSIIDAHFGYDGNPVPSRFACPEERIAMAQALREENRGMYQIVGGTGAHRPWGEYTAIARESGRNVCWAVIKGGQTNEGGHRRELEQTREFLAAGLNLYPQAACRPTLFEYTFDDLAAIKRWPLVRGILTARSQSEKLRVLSDPEFRRKFRGAIDGPGEFDLEMGPTSAEAAMRRKGFLMTEISAYPPEPALESRLAADIARERNVHIVDLILDMSVRTEFEARFRTPQSNFDEDELQEVLQDPNVILGLGDGGAHMAQLCDSVYATYLLKRWVRERGALTLEQAVHKLTGLNARVYGINNQGRLATGWPADLVVFDPDTVGPLPMQRVYDLPAGGDRLISKPVGIDSVIVNGAVLPQPGEPLDRGVASPGRLLRGRSGTA